MPGGAGERGPSGRPASEAPRPIHVSGIATLADAQVLYGSAHDIEASGRAPGFAGLLGEVWRDRGFGDFWGYALLAEGAAEACVEVELSAWDMAAPLVLIEEAGGRVTDFARPAADRLGDPRGQQRPPPRHRPGEAGRRIGGLTSAYR